MATLPNIIFHYQELADLPPVGTGSRGFSPPTNLLRSVESKNQAAVAQR